MKTKRGAPKKQNPSTEFLRIRCTEDDKSMWNEKAKKAGHSSLSAWIKKLANEAVI